jgi:hypothetical protein
MGPCFTPPSDAWWMVRGETKNGGNAAVQSCAFCGPAPQWRGAARTAGGGLGPVRFSRGGVLLSYTRGLVACTVLSGSATFYCVLWHMRCQRASVPGICIVFTAAFDVLPHIRVDAAAHRDPALQGPHLQGPQHIRGVQSFLKIKRMRTSAAAHFGAARVMARDRIFCACHRRTQNDAAS